MPINLRKYNNFDYSDAHVNFIIAGILGGLLPAHFVRQYVDFDVIAGDLYYLPLNLKVIKESEKEDTIRECYTNFATGLGAGINSLYKKLSSRYLGIGKRDVTDFLRKQTSYQLTKTINKKTTNRPQLAKYVNALWSCDLIDVENYERHNNRKKYILTAIDHFSRFVFAVGLVNRTAQSICDGFEEIFNTQSMVYPRKLISDNGVEFRGVFQQFCEDNDIIHVFTMTHSPTQNAIIENFNGKLRRMMADLFVRTNRLRWVDHLQDMLDSRNSDVHSVLKKAPRDLWKPVLDPVLDAKEIEAKDNMYHKAHRDIVATRSARLRVGDPVRVLLTALHTQYRDQKKKGNGKKIIVKYTTKIYFVKRIIRPVARLQDFQQLRYILQDENGDELWNQDGRPHKLYGSDLQLVDAHSAVIMADQDAHDLNKTNIVAV